MIRLRRAGLLASALLLVSVPRLGAQTVQNPVMDAVRSHLQRSARNMGAAASAMPADKFGFKPTDAQNSFGRILSHVAGSNEFLCSGLSGMDRPEAKVPDGEAPKDALIAAVQASFDYCKRALAGVTDAQLSGMVPFFGGREVTRAMVAVSLVGDWMDHYGQVAIYLRLNGILPPTARRGKGD